MVFTVRRKSTTAALLLSRIQKWKLPVNTLLQGTNYLKTRLKIDIREQDTSTVFVVDCENDRSEHKQRSTADRYQ